MAITTHNTDNPRYKTVETCVCVSGCVCVVVVVVVRAVVKPIAKVIGRANFDALWL